MSKAVGGAKKGTSVASSPGGKPARRSQRVTLRVAVVAYNDSKRGHSRSFKESTFVVRVSKHGGLLELESELPRGERFMLQHTALKAETECRVVSVTKNPGGKCYVGFEFTDGTVDFWRMSFPPPGARPIHEK